MKNIFLVFLIFANSAFGSNFRVRAREHFESHSLDLSGGKEAEFSGLSNTINLWFEVPYQYSIGLSVSPVIGKLTAGNQESETLFEKSVGFKAYGFEAKYFPIKTPIYLRHGIYAHEFADISGWGGLTTIGYEYPFSKLGMALEAGQRWYSLGDVKGKAFNVSIGFHFYKM